MTLKQFPFDTFVGKFHFLNCCSVFFLSSATIGISHPDIVVETNTLSSVPPPDITYTLSIPESTINNGLLSALQLEAIIYACQVLNAEHTLISDHCKWTMFDCDRVCIFAHAFTLFFASNTRLSFRIIRGQASLLEMEPGSERGALWQESSWRTTLWEGRSHYGTRDLLLRWITTSHKTSAQWCYYWVSIIYIFCYFFLLHAMIYWACAGLFVQKLFE